MYYLEVKNLEVNTKKVRFYNEAINLIKDINNGANTYGELSDNYNYECMQEDIQKLLDIIDLAANDINKYISQDEHEGEFLEIPTGANIQEIINDNTILSCIITNMNGFRFYDIKICTIWEENNENDTMQVVDVSKINRDMILEFLDDKSIIE